MRTWKIGDTETFTKTITDSDNQSFGDLSGDHNPVHFSKERMANTFFKKPIGNGIQTLSLIGSTIVKLFVTDETIVIALEQHNSFISPMYIGDTLTSKIIIDGIPQTNEYWLQCLVKNQDDKPVVSARFRIRVIEA
jgi:acyl dehydratase